MSLSSERERVIESLRAGIGASAEYVDPSEFVVIREVGGTLHFFAFKDDGSYAVASLGSGAAGVFEAAVETPDGVEDTFTFASGEPVMVFRNGVNETRLGSIADGAFVFDNPPAEGDDVEGLV